MSQEWENSMSPNSKYQTPIYLKVVIDLPLPNSTFKVFSSSTFHNDDKMKFDTNELKEIEDEEINIKVGGRNTTLTHLHISEVKIKDTENFVKLLIEIIKSNKSLVEILSYGNGLKEDYQKEN